MLENLTEEQYLKLINHLMNKYNEDMETIDWNLSFGIYEEDIKELFND